MTPQRGQDMYSPLESPTHIRLLVIHDHKRFTLEQHDLDAAPSYDCLSYRWDTRGDKKVNLINDTPFEVHEHLHDAIRHLSGTVWIDAICIDQSNIQEREAQVRIMGRIYKSARAVQGYIGEADPEDARNLDAVLDNLSTTIENCRTNDKSAEDNGLLPSANPGWVVLAQCLLSEFFTRKWIIQEFVLARELRLIYGSCVLDLKALDDCMECFKRASRPAEYVINARIDGLTSLVGMRGMKLTVLDSLNITRRFKCTVEVDSIYALLGICSDGQIVEVDYSKPTREIFLSVATELVAKGQGAQMLYQKLSKGFLDLPSWIPDWSSDGMLLGPHYFELFADHHGLVTGGPSTSMRVDGAIMHTGAVQFDSVKTLAELLVRPPRIRNQECDVFPSDFDVQINFLRDAHKTAVREYYELFDIFRGQATPVFRHFDYEAFAAALAYPKDYSPNEHEQAMADCVGFSMVMTLFDYRLCCTHDGRIGLVPLETEVGDVLAAIQGLGMPFVLRRSGEAWLMIGVCLIHGVMHGQLAERLDLKLQEIALI